MPTTPEPTREEIVDALFYNMRYLADQRINGDDDPAYQFTYSFESSQPSDLWRSYSGWTSFTNAEKAAVRAALDHIESVVNVTFVETSGADPDINIGQVEMSSGIGGIGGYSYAASNGELARYDSFAVFNNDYDLSKGIFASLILHEFGHALGLDHPFEGQAVLPDEYENNKYTLMSYTTNPETGQDPNTLAVYDILALQARWGANTSTNSGADTYTGPRAGTIVDTIWDAGGSDWIDASSKSRGVTIDLREGAFSRIDATSFDDLAIAYDTIIEHAKGSDFDDSLTGNDVGNKLYGLSGHDTITAHGGVDTITGGRGNDFVSAGAGNDDVKGGNGRDTLYGDGQNDTIDGGRGKDIIYGGDGQDVLVGGSGKDRFIYEESDDEDIISDFEDDIDTVVFNMNGVETRSQALNFASQQGDDLLFDFGGGDTLLILNMTIEQISNDLAIL